MSTIGNKAALELSKAEIDALQTSGLSRKTPFAIEGVSRGYFSVARYSGGCDFNGEHYTYNYETDKLTRDDVIKWVDALRKSLAALDAGKGGT